MAKVEKDSIAVT